MLALGFVLDKSRAFLFARAARSVSPVDSPRSTSILAAAATSYGSRPEEDVTIPTGFDPAAAALFEAIVEGAYLVANADGRFDDDERRTFEGIVVAACGGAVATQQIAALVAGLGGQLLEDGVDRRIETLAASVSKKEHAQEVLRIAALVAQASEGVSGVERDVLAKIAAHCGLEPGEVDVALARARGAMADASADC